MPTSNNNSRLEEVSRRAFLKRSALLGTALIVPSALIAACGDDDDAFASATTSEATTTTAAVASTTTGSEGSTTTTAGGSAAIPTSARMAIDFTYSPTNSNRAANPYIAAWIEDTEGDLVVTVGLWLLQSQKGLRWVDELLRWNSVDGSSTTIDTISSATRTPGDYSLLWDGVDMDGLLVAVGDYYVCIESAREHGPYSLIREQLTLGDESFDLVLPADGELTNASVSYRV